MSQRSVASERFDARLEAQKLANALERGDTRALLDAFHGRSKPEQKAIIEAFNRLPSAQDVVVQPTPSPFVPAFMMTAHTVKNDFLARMERQDPRTRAYFDAYRRNPSSQLDAHDKVYLCLKGWGTYEEGIHDILGRMTGGDIQRLEARFAGVLQYRNDYGSLEDALKSELSGIDEARALMLLRGRDHLTQAHRDAFDIYAAGAGTYGTSEGPMLRPLEGKTRAQVDELGRAYQDLFGRALKGDIIGELSGLWEQRGLLLLQGTDAPKEVRAQYVALSGMEFVRGQIEWTDLQRILTANIDPQGQNGPTLAEVEKAYAKETWGADMTLALRYAGNAQTRALIDVLERGSDVQNGPEARAIALYHHTIGTWGTDEQEACDLLASASASERSLIDQAFRKLYGKSVSEALSQDFADSPAWLARVLDHWSNGELSAEALLFHTAKGAGEEKDALRALSDMPLEERRGLAAGYAQRYGKSGPATLDAAIATFSDRGQRTAKDLLAAARADTQDMAQVRARVLAQIGRERTGDGWAVVSSTLMDRFGWTGTFVDEAGRDFFLEVKRAHADGAVDNEELGRILSRYHDFGQALERYQKEKDETAETAGDMAAAAAALVVTVASGGTATLLVIALGAGSAAGAKVATERAFKGRDYRLDSAEFWKDVAVGGVDGAVTVATAGLSKTATGAKFGKAVLVEGVAGGAGGAAAAGVRTAVDGATWKDSDAGGRLLESVAVGGAFGFAGSAAFSALFRGAIYGAQRAGLRRAEERAAGQLGKGKVSSHTITDTHGHAQDVKVQTQDLRGGRLRHIGDVINKGDQGGLAVGSRDSTRGVIAHMKRQEATTGQRYLTNLGNHEEVLFAAMDDPMRYPVQAGAGEVDRATAALHKDVALRRLLGKKTTNFYASVMKPYGVGGNDMAGQELRRSLGARINGALKHNGAGVMEPSTVARLRQLSRVVSKVDAPLDTKVCSKLLDDLENELGGLVERGALTRRDIVMLHAAASSSGDSELGSKQLFVLFSDHLVSPNGALDTHRALNAVHDELLARGMLGAATQRQLAGFGKMAEDLDWLQSRMVAFQVDPESGALLLHAGLPYEVVDGVTVFRPERLLDAQRMVRDRRWLSLHRPDQFHLNPAWSGESARINPLTAGSSKDPVHSGFSFRQPDVTGDTYGKALDDFSDALRKDPDALRAISVDPTDFHGVHFIETGHESVRADWVQRRVAELVATGVEAKAATKQAWGEVRVIRIQDEISRQFDASGGRHIRTDFGLEDGRFEGREAGGRVDLNADGTVRVREVSTSQDGQLARATREGLPEWQQQTVRLKAAGAIELPAHVRVREVAKLRQALAQAGIDEASVVRLMGGNLTPDAALERYLVDYYRVAGRNEGAVLNSLAWATGQAPEAVAVELATPMDALRELLGRGTAGKPVAEAMGAMRTAARGVVRMPGPVTREQLRVHVKTLLALRPGSRVVSEGTAHIVVELKIEGVLSTVVLQTDARSPYIVIASIPGAVARQDESSRGNP